MILGIRQLQHVIKERSDSLTPQEIYQILQEILDSTWNAGLLSVEDGLVARDDPGLYEMVCT